MTTSAESTTVCPQCEQLLHAVGIKTVKHLLKFEIARQLRDGHYEHCPNPDCNVIYIRTDRADGSIATELFYRDDLRDCAMPNAKGRDRLVCYCFGYTVGEIQDDAAASVQRIPAAIAAEVKAGNCACEVKNPAGH